MQVSPIVSYVAQRIKNNQNFLCVITGGTGSGKSYSALALALKVHEVHNITHKPQIIYDVEDLLRIIGELLKEPKPTYYKPGLCLILDESGLTANSRNFMTKFNKVLSMIVQSFRFMNLVVFFCLPDISFIDIHLRKMFHAHFITNRIDKRRQICYLKPYRLETDQFKGELKHRPFKDQIGEDHFIIREFGVIKPPKELLEDYERCKKEYMAKFYNQLQQDITGISPKQQQLSKKAKDTNDNTDHSTLTYLPPPPLPPTPPGYSTMEGL